MYCWICSDVVFNNYYLLPTDDETINESCKIEKQEACFKFMYNILCENCLNMYVDNYPLNFKQIKMREIYGKNINKNYKYCKKNN